MHLSDEPYFYLFQTQKFSREEKEKFLREYASEGHDNGAEMLLDLIRRLDNGNKITILCNLINYRVNEDISMTDFMRLTSSLERVPITDLRFLNNYTVRSWKSEMLCRPHALMTAYLISISGITRLSSMSMHPYFSGIGMSTHAVSSVSVYLRMTDSVMHT